MPFGFDISIRRTALTAAPSAVPVLDLPLQPAADDVAKADRSVNAAGTELIQGVAQSMTTGKTTSPAFGVRPTPGGLPTPLGESTFNPLVFQFPWNDNQRFSPRSGYGTPFATLRNLANVSPELYACVQTCKDQMAAQTWDFTPKDKTKKGAEFDDKINRARAFFAFPDRVSPFGTWIQTIVDEMLVIDALSIYKRKTMSKKMFGAQGEPVGAYELIDGSTIKVLLDARGMTPRPPEIAYRQYIYGAPMAGGDCTTEQLMYLPRNVRTWSPYGFSPTEALLLIVSAALNRTIYRLSYYVKGNIPEALVGAPDNWTPKQMSDFMEYWNVLLSGDPTNRSGLRIVTESMAKNVHEFRKDDFSTSWELWLLKLICAVYGVTPSEIGFTDDVNRATAKAQGATSQRRWIKPASSFIKSFLDAMLATDLGLGDLEAVCGGGEGEDKLLNARVDDLQVRSGIKSVDEIRTRNGDPVLGVPAAIVTMSGPIFWQAAYKQSQETPEPVTPGTGDRLDREIDLEPAPKGKTNEGDDVRGQVAEKAVALHAELRKYRDVAIKAVKGRKPVGVFKSIIIPPSLHGVLIEKLAHVSTVGDVNEIFADARESVTKAAIRLSKSQNKHQNAMRKSITGTLSELGADFVEHALDKLPSE